LRQISLLDDEKTERNEIHLQTEFVAEIPSPQVRDQQQQGNPVE
jgi:hypothetical protein